MSTRRSAASRALRPADREFAADVEYYLTLQPRQLPSRYLYDALGSALFDAICELPWYRVTHAERSLLASHGSRILSDASISRIVELGPGNGGKLVTLLEAGHTTARHLDVHLIDVSENALARAVHALDRLEHVEVMTHVDDYENGLAAVGEACHASAGRTLVLFLGSNIGNFDAPGAAALLTQIRAALRRGDLLLLGADLAKSERELLLAYDDPLGVTAAFNRNLLVRINRELGGTFHVDRFAHRAVWNAIDSRVEMHLVSRAAQHVRIAGAALELDFYDGETIWTESSYKYEPAGVAGMLRQAGFEPVEQWLEPDARFALTLAQVG